MLLRFYSSLLFLFLSAISPAAVIDEKILICGVCRNVESALTNDIFCIEKLGSYFLDYAVIIAEDNSTDLTATLLKAWQAINPKVNINSEKYDSHSLSREEKIARARNRALQIAREERFDGFAYLMMVDLDFPDPWPIEEIIKTVQTKGDWDAVSSNGMLFADNYFDRYAFRDKNFPLGPELIGEKFWQDVDNCPFAIPKGQKNWCAVYSAFGGLAIYKRESIIPFRYSATVTEDLANYYKKIIAESDPNNLQVKKYKANFGQDECYIHFVKVGCCEHLPLHASMALHGRGRFYINPALVIRYKSLL